MKSALNVTGAQMHITHHMLALLDRLASSNDSGPRDAHDIHNRCVRPRSVTTGPNPSDGAPGSQGSRFGRFSLAALGLTCCAMVAGCADNASSAAGDSASSASSADAEGEPDVAADPELGRLETSPSSLVFEAGLSPGTEQRQTLTLVAEMPTPVTVRGVTIDEAPAETPDQTPAFRIVEVRGLVGGDAQVTFAPPDDELTELDLELGEEGGTAAYTAIEVVVGFSDPPSAEPRSGVLRVFSDSADASEFTVNLSAVVVEPRLAVDPSVVQFSEVSPGGVASRSLRLSNQGAGSLQIDSLAFKGSPTFRLRVGDVEYAPSGVIALDPPLSISPGMGASLEVFFEPVNEKAATASLYVRSNDPAQPAQGALVKLEGNLDPPCLALTPPEILDFGPRHIGQPVELPVQLDNCGSTPLALSEIAFEPGSSDSFSLDFADLPGAAGALPPSESDPLVLAVGASATLRVRFAPDALSPPGEGGNPQDEIGTIRFVAKSGQTVALLEARGYAVADDCPAAMIDINEGPEVTPQTTLHFSAAASTSVAGEIAEYQWAVIQPAGSASDFVPSSNVVNPTFTVNVSGVYTFQLTVTDATGTQSCAPAEATVAVVPDEGIHVELVWSTPGDPDEFDEGSEVGTDLDLHFAHPYAGGPDLDDDGEPDGWFDVPFDVFWFNSNPSWENVNPAIDDDPSLDRDDTDGAGPELLTLNMPVSGNTYRVGVHYWDDHQYGESIATVYVYVYSNLVWQSAPITLQHLDMWEVCTIQWDADTPTVSPVTNSAGKPKVTPNYENSIFN